MESDVSSILSSSGKSEWDVYGGWRWDVELVLKVENFNLMDTVEVSGAWQFWQTHSRLTHSSQFS